MELWNRTVLNSYEDITILFIVITDITKQLRGITLQRCQYNVQFYGINITTTGTSIPMQVCGHYNPVSLSQRWNMGKRVNHYIHIQRVRKFPLYC